MGQLLANCLGRMVEKGQLVSSSLLSLTAAYRVASSGPHEIARELQLAQGERRGALSYFLLDALEHLRRRCTEITHESLYEHLRVRFRASWPQQTPMRYGNKDMSFFGHLGARSDTAYFRIYYRAEDQRLCLDAGLAHGIHPNDEYAVYPLGSEDATNQSDIDILATIRAENVGPLTSEDEQEACMFNLAVNDRQEYEILDGTLQRIRSLPAVPIDTPDAEHHVLATLQHLAEFKYAEGIENRLPNSSLEASFSLLSSADGKAPDASAVHDIEHGGIWRLALDTPRRLDKTLARAKLPGTGSMGNSELHHTHRDARERLKTGTSFFN
ncbi:hypothetical protein VB005_07810 [Metarhizium brunneum]